MRALEGKQIVSTVIVEKFELLCLDKVTISLGTKKSWICVLLKLIKELIDDLCSDLCNYEREMS